MKIMARKKVLIVEKQGIIALDVQNTLKKMGFDVIGIDTDPENIEMHLLNNSPDLVISDYTMHESALNFTEKVVLNYKVPIVYITGSVSAGDSQSSIMENCAILPKPFSSREFKKVVREMINRDLKV